MFRCKHIALVVVGMIGMQATTVRAVTVFNDTFATSTLNAATPAAPTATSTDYSVLASKNAASSSIAPGSLKPRITTTSSGLNEVQAKFSSTPYALAAEGDFIELSVTFVPTGILYTVNNTAATLGIGLYNSHGTTPVTGGGMTTGLLGTADVTYAAGFATAWEGYATKLRLASGELFNRPAQTAANNQNQDLIFHGGVTGGFNSPGASIVTPNAATGLQLTDGSTYTYAFKITLAAGGVLDLVQNVYAGADSSAANVFTQTSQTTALQTIATQFDGLALGYRGTNDTTAAATEHSLNISRIGIDSNVVVVPPTENANFDGDAQVDGDDFLKWQQGLGLAGQTNNANGDANGSGVVDGTDLGIWRSHFGQPTAVVAGSAVPEPATAALAAIVCVAACGLRRRAGIA